MSVLRVVLLCSALAMVSASASSGDGLLFGGVFQIGDPYCDYCTSANVLTPNGHECGCPAGYTAWPAMPGHTGEPYGLLPAANGKELLRVMTPCTTPYWHSSLAFCIASSTANATVPAPTAFARPAPSSAPSEFAGVYQLEDGNGAKSGRTGCRHANPITGDCSCPVDAIPIELRVMTSAVERPVQFGKPHNLNSAQPYGASLVMCARKQLPDHVATNFAGAYQLEDSTSAAICRVPNPITGACSCPASSTTQQFRVMTPDGVPSTVHVCGARVLRSPMIELCPGVEADATGTTPIGNALAQCLFYHPNFLNPLDIPVGTYLINEQVTLRGQLRTAGADAQGTCLATPAQCATLRAAPSMTVPMFSSNGFILTHIILDGNKAQRQSMVSSCNTQSLPKAGSNAYSVCSGCVFAFNAFINAVCGSGLYFTGEGIIMTYNLFRNNGDKNDVTRAWADGLTMTGADGSLVSSNKFIDNSGSGWVIGGGAGSLHISNEVVMQSTTGGFGGLTFDTLHGFHFSEFRNTTITNNTINGNGLLDFGMTLGGRPWYAGAPPVIGGEPITPVSGNTINGCAVNLNCDTAQFFTVWNNKIGDPVGRLTHCSKSPSALNISPDSRVDRRGESTPSSTRDSYAGCVPGL